MAEQPDPASVATAFRVLDDFLTCLNAGDIPGFFNTLNYPHVRIASEKVAIWATREEAEQSYMQAFNQRAGGTWDHTTWDSREVVQTSPDKVHVAVQFTRYDRADNPIATYKSLYIVSRVDGHWGIQARSSFAP